MINTIYLISFISIIGLDLMFRRSFSVAAITIFVTTFVIVLPGDPEANQVFWLSALVGIWISYILEAKSFYRSYLSQKITVRQQYIFKFAGVTCCIILLLSLTTTIYNNGGIVAAFFRARVDEYLRGGIVKVNLFSTLVYALIPFYILFMGSFFEKRKFQQFFACFIILVAYYIFNADTRLPLLMLLMTPVYLLFLDQSRYMRMLTVCIFGPLILISTVVFINFGGYLRSGVGSGVSLIDLLSLRKFSEQFGYREWVSNLISYTDANGIRWGIDWLLNPVISLIPRAVWSEKPITSMSNILHQNVGNAQLGDGNYIFTFTIFGEGYYQLGYFGCMLAPIFLLFLFKILVGLTSDLPGAQFFAAWTYFRFIPYIRAELPIFMVLLFALELLIFRRIFIKRR